jgi:hypothetical protein
MKTRRFEFSAGTGSEFVGNLACEVQPLADRLRAHGIKRRLGQSNVWGGRPSLPDVDYELAEMRRDELQARIDGE